MRKKRTLFIRLLFFAPLTFGVKGMCRFYTRRICRRSAVYRHVNVTLAVSDNRHELVVLPPQAVRRRCELLDVFEPIRQFVTEFKTVAAVVSHDRDTAK